LYVTPSARGKGFGKALLAHLIDYCRENGFGRLDWSVLSWNEPSIGFYQAMGADIMPDWRICRLSFG
jgi:GNAT superfamily N-acetyltransferase